VVLGFLARDDVCTHEQVFVRVNAPVDRGAADLVTALSAFPKLQTVESCEDSNGWGWVTFVYGIHPERSWEDLAKFVLQFLGPRIVDEPNDPVTLRSHLTSLQNSGADALRLPIT